MSCRLIGSPRVERDTGRVTAGRPGHERDGEVGLFFRFAFVSSVTRTVYNRDI